MFDQIRSGWIRGQARPGDLEANSYKPKKIAIETVVTAESQQGGFSWKLRAGRLEADISPAGNAERVRTAGNVEVERIGGDSRQVMTSRELDATSTRQVR